MTTPYADLSLKIRNYKCFAEEEQGFDEIRPINLIIGRNNSGKSTLLELVDFAIQNKLLVPEAQWHKFKEPAILLESKLTVKEIEAVFQKTTSSQDIGNHFEFGKKWIGQRFKWQILNKVEGNKKIFISIENPFTRVDVAKYQNLLANAKTHPLVGKVFKRISSDRNIDPEGDTGSDNLTVLGNGRGATNIIQNYINKSSLPTDLVKKVLLKSLNDIFVPDATFMDIVCQKHIDGNWEIYLEEKDKGSVSLSHTGSGLKTIILVLIFLYLTPSADKQKLSNYVFGFEELENNLHPALLRRLLLFLRQKAIEDNFIIFITTHSNVAIDLFSRDKNAQIIHVTHDSEKATVKTIKTYIENKGVLDDLDVRASDLLQSNGIVWVEGPSDRLYINRWISLLTDGMLQEGVHYQCVFYGGRLLAHLSSEDPSFMSNDWVSVLRVNSNSVIVMDSDMKNQHSDINRTKNRIKAEIDSMSGLAWVTQGREIENYIPSDVICHAYSTESIRQVEQYESFVDYLNEIKAEEGHRFVNNKPMYAERYLQYFTKENISDILDLKERVTEIADRIKRWNKIGS